MLAVHGASASQAVAPAQGLLYGMVQQQSMMKAFIDNFWLLGVIRPWGPVPAPPTCHGIRVSRFQNRA